MKVLVATGLYPPEIGGPATHIEILEREMPARGIEIVTVPFGWVRTYPKIVRHVVYTFLLLRHSRGVSCVYALDPVSVGLPALLVSIIARKKFVLRVVGDYAWEQASGRYGLEMVLDEFVHAMRTQKYIVRALGMIERFVARRADLVVVPSEYLKKIVGAWKVPNEKMRVIYNAFTPFAIRESRGEIRRMFEYAGTVLISVGRLVPWKGFATLISLVPKLREEIPDISLVIVGDGPEKDHLVRVAAEYGVSDRVRFVDRQPKETLAVAISGADLFVLNTGYEGFSHQLLEVMSLGVSIVTTTAGGNTELLEHDKTALLVPYDDRDALRAAIVRTVKDGALRERLSTAARHYANALTVERMVDAVYGVLKEVATVRS